MQLNQIIQADVRKGLAMIPDGIVNTTVTSPPYYALRDYGFENQIGLERTPQEFVDHLVQVFREVRRVTANDGTLWMNMGDSYNNKNGHYSPSYDQHAMQAYLHSQKPKMKPKVKLMKNKDMMGIPWMLAFALRDDGADTKACRVLEKVMSKMSAAYEENIPDKTLYVLQDMMKEYKQAKGNGWYLRQDIIWHKPNPMPESTSDRCTKSHEYIFLFSKSPKYFFDSRSIATPYADKTLTTHGVKMKGNGNDLGLVASHNWANTMEERKPKDWNKVAGWSSGPGDHSTLTHNQKVAQELKEGGYSTQKGRHTKRGLEIRNGQEYTPMSGHSGNYDFDGNLIGGGLANKRSVWTINTESYDDDHFATFPEEIPFTCIRAGSKPGGLVLDPFAGTGTTCISANKLGRKFLGIEGSKEYHSQAEKRILKECGSLFL